VIRRILFTVGLVLVALSIWGDPYTFHLTGSDAVVPAPLWQTTLALLDLGLVVAAVISLVRSRWRAALSICGGEFLYALAFNALLVARDGIDRFYWGFGAESHVLDFVIVFSLRALIIMALLWSFRDPERRAA